MATDSIWTCRAGFEPDLAEELDGGRVIAPALCRGREIKDRSNYDERNCFHLQYSE